MTTHSNMPPFGDILNAGIQAIKQLSNRSNGITPKAFDKKLQEIANIKDAHLKMSFINPELYFFEDEEDMSDSCYACLSDIVLICLTAMGAVKSGVFNLEANVGKSSVHLMLFDKQVTPENLIELDPLGKVYFWLIGDNFSSYRNMDVSPSTYESDLERFDAKSFRAISAANLAAYGEDGDPLINHLISEAMRRTSVFMNNYANVIAANEHVKVTPKTILNEVFNLTPLQFEHFCLNIIEASLKKEDPNANFSAEHTGKSNDGGIDGVIVQECSKGEVHTYYIQAKLYSEGKNISNRELRNFVGGFAPDSQYHHGIFITTSDFTRPARDYAENLGSHSLILINQTELLDLMLEHEIGLQKVQTETLVVNSSFFKKFKKH